MYYKYFVISKEWYPTRQGYVSGPWSSVDAARKRANVLAQDFPENRYYVCEAVEYMQTTTAVQTVQLDN